MDRNSSDFLRAAHQLQRQDASNPPPIGRAPRGRWPADCVALRPHWRNLGIEIAFQREGRAGSRIIRMRGHPSASVITVGNIDGFEARS